MVHSSLQVQEDQTALLRRHWRLLSTNPRREDPVVTLVIEPTSFGTFRLMSHLEGQLQMLQTTFGLGENEVEDFKEMMLDLGGSWKMWALTSIVGVLHSTFAFLAFKVCDVSFPLLVDFGVSCLRLALCPCCLPALTYVKALLGCCHHFASSAFAPRSPRSRSESHLVPWRTLGMAAGGLALLTRVRRAVGDLRQNDVGFWKARTSLEGLSVRTFFSSFVCQFVILLKLLDAPNVSAIITTEVRVRSASP
jgi:hypothetical protein